MIELHEYLLLGQGNARYCYIHPEDSSKLIKVEKTRDAQKQQNTIDYIYYSYLKAQNVDLSSISTCYHWVETSIGAGLVFERIENFDNSPALTFEQAIIQRTISKETQEQSIRVAKANQKPGQTKEQTKFIAQGIEKGISEYKKQQKIKARERDKQRKKSLSANANSATTDTQVLASNNSADLSRRLSVFSMLPWLLLLASWGYFLV